MGIEGRGFKGGKRKEENRDGREKHSGCLAPYFASPTSPLSVSLTTSLGLFCKTLSLHKTENLTGPNGTRDGAKSWSLLELERFEKTSQGNTSESEQRRTYLPTRICNVVDNALAQRKPGEKIVSEMLSFSLEDWVLVYTLFCEAKVSDQDAATQQRTHLLPNSEETLDKLDVSEVCPTAKNANAPSGVAVHMALR